MAGYQASERITGAPVRRARPPLRREPEPSAPASTLSGAETHPGDRDPIEQWIEDLRTTWSQTTFFLFDPQSWR